MNEKSSVLLLLVIVMLGLVGFVIYDAKTSNRLGFGEESKDNWQWDDKWENADPKVDPKVEPPKVEPPKPETPTPPPAPIVTDNYAEAIKKSAELKIPVLVFFEADWCSWCQKLKKDTLSDSKVQEAMKKYIVVHINVDKDKTTAKKFGVKYLPSYVVTNAKEESVKVDGGFKTAAEFLQWLGSEEQPPQVDPDQPQEPNRRFFRKPQMCSEITEE